jgi:hypothetical protein
MNLKDNLRLYALIFDKTYWKGRLTQITPLNIVLAILRISAVTIGGFYFTQLQGIFVFSLAIMFQILTWFFGGAELNDFLLIDYRTPLNIQLAGSRHIRHGPNLTKEITFQSGRRELVIFEYE